MNVILFIGQPGTGKTVQAEILAKEHDYRVLHIGHELREMSKKDPVIQSRTDQGLPVDAVVIRDIVNNFLQLHKSHNVIIDGGAYSKDQLIMLNELFIDQGINPLIFEFTNSAETSLARMNNRQRGITRSNELILRNYNTNIRPLQQNTYSYESRITINSEHGINDVSQEIQKALAAYH